jgi:beta-N-acetylglucosaminidase
VANVSKWTVTVTGSKKDTKSTKNPDTNKTYVWYEVSYSSNSKTVKGYVREDLIKVKEYKLDTTFSAKLSEFPESYRNDLILLHAIYPNWTFVADNVDSTFSTAVSKQDFEFRKLVETDYNSWRSMREGCYDWSKSKFITSDGGKYGVSREVIAYYMDPRNFLNANDIYLYMQQGYDSTTQTVEGIEKIVEGTFLDAKITDKNDKYYGKRYAAVIRYAGSKSKVNAYVLASTIIQEQGINGTVLGKGTTYKSKKVYNFFNYKASGSTSADIINNGSKYAYDQKWFTPTESIVGGAKLYGSGYINVGQDTYFYKNYNVHNPDELWHQYAQNVADSLTSSRRLQETYSSLKDMALTFRIPVFELMPSTVSKLPSKSQKYNNYYFEELKANGLTSFDRYKTKYSISTDGDLFLTYKLPNGATYTGEETYALTEGKNTIKLKVKSETGYNRTYTLTITATKDAALTVATTNETLKKEEDGEWYYYLNGVKTEATTLVKYNDKWFYVKDGKWDKTANTLFKFNGVWFSIKNGKWDKTQNTLVKYSGKWFYVKGGKWVKDTLIFKYSGKRFYVKSGIVQLDFSGTKTINGVKYKIKNGKVV